jgi:hypothetical protein
MQTPQIKFVDRGCLVVSATDPYVRILGFLVLIAIGKTFLRLQIRVESHQCYC